MVEEEEEVEVEVVGMREVTTGDGVKGQEVKGGTIIKPLQAGGTPPPMSLLLLFTPLPLPLLLTKVREMGRPHPNLQPSPLSEEV